NLSAALGAVIHFRLLKKSPAPQLKETAVWRELFCYICGMRIFFAYVLLAAASSSVSFGQQPSLQQLAEGELPSLLSIYKDIHSHPELSTQEQRTSTIVAKELRAAGCEVTDNFGTYEKPNAKCYGVVGVMKNGDGPTVLIRTDMDAL